jgi:thiol-disulfide isomerase/thioredoxin
MYVSKFFLTMSLVFGMSCCSAFAGQKCVRDSSKECANHSAKIKCAHTASDSVCHHDTLKGLPNGAKKDEGAAGKVNSAPSNEILFFMNPNGHPCQMQLSILDGMKGKLASLATIKYIKTTEEADQETFEKYGIRGLPSLIIIDKSGKELKRFTPGIQNEETILAALKSSPAK